MPALLPGQRELPSSMAEPQTGPAPAPLTPTQWLICATAAMGFAFDIYELLTLPLVVRPALLELGGIRPGTPEFSLWFSLLFYVPALCGGCFGLAGGYLTDRLGRKRILCWSIILYACASFAAGFSTTLPMLLVLRCLVFVGVCVEFVAAVAWLAELFPNARQREGALGGAQAFSSIGGLMVAVVNGIVAAWAVNRPAPLLVGLELPALQLPALQLPDFLAFLGCITHPHAHWRYTLMSGLVPALLLMAVRPFLQESPQWLGKRQAGTLKRPSIAELFSPGLRRTTMITTLMVAFSYAASFGALLQVPQIVPGLPEVRAEVAARQPERARPEAGSPDAASTTAGRAGATTEQLHSSHLMKVQEVGGLAGRIALAGLALCIVSRRLLLRLFLVPGLIAMPLCFGWAAVTGLDRLEWGIFAASFCVVAQFSFWGNYLPRVFPLHLRGTGESFAVNVGGRMIGTCFAAVTQWLAYWLPVEAMHAHKVAFVAAGVALAAFAVNIAASFLLPEPQTGSLPD